MHLTANEISTNILTNKVKSSLFSLGFNEKYVAFDYMTDILTSMLKQNNNNLFSFQKALDMTTQKFNVSKSTIAQGISKIIKCCNGEIILKLQFDFKNTSTLNKIKIIQSLIEEQF